MANSFDIAEHFRQLPHFDSRDSLDRDHLRHRSQEASNLLNNELMREAISRLTTDSVRRWENSEPGPAGEDDRVTAYYDIRSVKRLLTKLQGHMEQGTLLAAEEAVDQYPGTLQDREPM